MMLGSFIGDCNCLVEGRMIFGTQSSPVVLPRHRVQDIDTMEDWIRAEAMFKAGLLL